MFTSVNIREEGTSESVEIVKKKSMVQVANDLCRTIKERTESTKSFASLRISLSPHTNDDITYNWESPWSSGSTIYL